MDKINWKEKLSSRKFWAALAGWLTSLLAAFHVPDGSIAQVSVIIAGIGALAVYMLAEAATDRARAGEITPIETVTEDNNGVYKVWAVYKREPEAEDIEQ